MLTTPKKLQGLELITLLILLARRFCHAFEHSTSQYSEYNTHNYFHSELQLYSDSKIVRLGTPNTIKWLESSEIRLDFSNCIWKETWKLYTKSIKKNTTQYLFEYRRHALDKYIKPFVIPSEVRSIPRCFFHWLLCLGISILFRSQQLIFLLWFELWSLINQSKL